jgi:hypothetical protein
MNAQIVSTLEARTFKGAKSMSVLSGLLVMQGQLNAKRRLGAMSREHVTRTKMKL